MKFSARNALNPRLREKGMNGAASTGIQSIHGEACMRASADSSRRSCLKVFAHGEYANHKLVGYHRGWV